MTKDEQDAVARARKDMTWALSVGSAILADRRVTTSYDDLRTILDALSARTFDEGDVERVRRVIQRAIETGGSDRYYDAARAALAALTRKENDDVE